MGPKVLKLVVSLALFAVPTVVYAAPAHADGPSSVITLVNNLRNSAKVAPLAVDPTLNSVAQQWANHMAGTDVLAHNPNLATQAPSGWTKMGENIGDGYSLNAVFNALVASPDHYANMVDPSYNRTGVGVATDSNGQVWIAEDFGDYPPPVPATFVFPTTGDVIFPQAQAFSWQQTPGAKYYVLTVGSSRGGWDLTNSGLLTATQLSYTVPALPGSETLWARIYTYEGGIWNWVDASFRVTGPSMAFLTEPTNGQTDVDTTQPFTWTPVASATAYAVTVGTSQGIYDLANSGPLAASVTSYAVPALPTGQTLWARMYSYIAGSWHTNDVTFTAAARLPASRRH